MKRRGLLTGMGAGALGVAGFGAWSVRTRPNPYYDGPVSDHFDGRVFHNPGGMPPGSLRDLLKWRMTNNPAAWPQDWPSPFHGAKPEPSVGGDRILVTLIGHASLLIQVSGMNILTDPVWSPRVSPFSFAGPKRVNAPGVTLEDLPGIDVVLVTHNHYDHLDLATLAKLTDRDNPRIVTPLGNDTIIRNHHSAARLIAGDWGGRIENGNIAVHFVPMHHWSARGMSDRRMALWSGFVLETDAGNILHIGDTGFHDGSLFLALAAQFGPFRLANIPIGAYEPRWFMKAQHVNPDEAVQAMKLANANWAVGHHWGTFQLTAEGIEEPRLALEIACEAHGVPVERFRAMRPGESFEVPTMA